MHYIHIILPNPKYINEVIYYKYIDTYNMLNINKITNDIALFIIIYYTLKLIKMILRSNTI